MTLLIRESDVRDLLPMPEAVAVVRDALATQAMLGGANLARHRLDLKHGLLNIMAASVPGAGSAGLKAYSTGRGGARFLVALWDRTDGRLLALIEADLMGRLRTGAASGIATDLLAGPEAGILAILGSGRQAPTQIEAVAAVRTLREVRVFSRNAERRFEFARKMRQRLDLPVRPLQSAQEAVEGADVISTITTAAEPVVLGRWLDEGAHVNAAGSNVASRREVDAEVIRRATVIAVDSVEQAQVEAGDLILSAEEGAVSWDRAVELQDLVAGQVVGRTSAEEITFFKSLGIAVEDVAVARHVFDKAVALGRGEVTTFGDAG